MTPLSARHLPAALGMVLLAASLVALSVLFPRTRDECRDPVALLDTARIRGSVPEREVSSHYGRGVFQWSEGGVAAEFGPVLYAVVRSHRPDALYQAPLRWLRSPAFVYRIARESIDVDGLRVPIRLAYLRPQGDGVDLVGYLFVHGGRPVDLLLPRQLATGFPQLLRGTLPLTLYRIHARGEREATGRIEEQVRSWLAAAWRAHREACLP